jgi:hypothetical protein
MIYNLSRIGALGGKVMPMPGKKEKLVTDLEQKLERYTTAKDAIKSKFKTEENKLDELIEVIKEEIKKSETKPLHKERLNYFLKDVTDQKNYLGEARRDLDSAYVMLKTTKSVEIRVTPAKKILGILKSPIKASKSLMEMNTQLKDAKNKFQQELKTSIGLLDKSSDLRMQITNNHKSIKETIDPSYQSTRPRSR